VPVLADIAAVGATSALDLFTGTTRWRRPSNRRAWRSPRSTRALLRDVARCYIETDSRLVDHAALAWPSAPERAARPPRYFTETFCVASRFRPAANGERIDAVRDAIETATAARPLPDPPHQPLEAADRSTRRPGFRWPT